MSRKRSINELIELRRAAAERANATGSQLAFRAADLANQYIGNIERTKGYQKENKRNLAKYSNALKADYNTALGMKVDGAAERKYSENTYKGLNKG